MDIKNFSLLFQKLLLVLFLFFSIGIKPTNLFAHEEREKDNGKQIPQDLKVLFNPELVEFLEQVWQGALGQKIFKNNNHIEDDRTNKIFDKLKTLLSNADGLASSFLSRKSPFSGGVFGNQEKKLPFISPEEYQNMDVKKEVLETFDRFFLSEREKTLKQMVEDLTPGPGQLGPSLEENSKRKQVLTDFVNNLDEKDLVLIFMFIAKQIKKFELALDQLNNQLNSSEQEKKKLVERNHNRKNKTDRIIKGFNIRENLLKRTISSYQQRFNQLLDDPNSKDKIEGEPSMGMLVTILQKLMTIAENQPDNNPVEGNPNESTLQKKLIYAEKTIKSLKEGYTTNVPPYPRVSPYLKQQEKPSPLSNLKNELPYLMNLQNYHVGYKRGNFLGFLLGFVVCLFLTNYSKGYLIIRDHLLGKLMEKSLYIYQTGKAKFATLIARKKPKKK